MSTQVLYRLLFSSFTYHIIYAYIIRGALYLYKTYYILSRIVSSSTYIIALHNPSLLSLTSKNLNYPVTAYQMQPHPFGFFRQPNFTPFLTRAAKNIYYASFCIVAPLPCTLVPRHVSRDTVGKAKVIISVRKQSLSIYLPRTHAPTQQPEQMEGWRL